MLITNHHKKSYSRCNTWEKLRLSRNFNFFNKTCDTGVFVVLAEYKGTFCYILICKIYVRAEQRKDPTD